MVNVAFLPDFLSDIKSHKKDTNHCSNEDGYLKVDSPFWDKTLKLQRGTSSAKRECFWYIDLDKFVGKGHLEISVDNFHVRNKEMSDS